MRKLALLLVVLASLSLPTAAQATFSGKPGKIALSHYNVNAPAADGDIWLVNNRSIINPHNSTFFVAETDPAFSPDGRSIVFVRRTDGDADIWIVGARGDNARPLVQSPYDDVQPSFFPSGRSIVFTQFDAAGDWEVRSVRLNGTNPAKLIDNAADPTVSPNGRLIAYRQVGSGGGVKLLNRNTGRSRTLTSGSAQKLDFAPGGSRIVFTGLRRCKRGGDLRWAILSVGIRRRGARIIRRSCRHDYIDPAWSPNGRRIVFVLKRQVESQGDTTRFRLVIMDRRGRVTSDPSWGPGANSLDPSWQPR